MEVHLTQKSKTLMDLPTQKLSYRILCKRRLPPDNDFEITEDALLNFIIEGEFFRNFVLTKCVNVVEGIRNNSFYIEVRDVDVDQINNFAKAYLEKFGQNSIFIDRGYPYEEKINA